MGLASAGERGAGTWHEITPRAGDTFTITDEYLEFDKDPDGEFVDYLGGTMTFGDTPLPMVPYFAYPGTTRWASGSKTWTATSPGNSQK